jgi:hypothetical protein
LRENAHERKKPLNFRRRFGLLDKLLDLFLDMGSHFRELNALAVIFGPDNPTHGVNADRGSGEF